MNVNANLYYRSFREYEELPEYIETDEQMENMMLTFLSKTSRINSVDRPSSLSKAPPYRVLLSTHLSKGHVLQRVSFATTRFSPPRAGTLGD